MPLPFTWSWSRYQTWLRCPRQFWLTVYAAPDAKRAGPGTPEFEVWIQRHLLGRAQWAGLLAHQAVEWFLKATVEGRHIDPNGIVERTLREAKRTLELSSTEFYRGDPKSFRGLADHYYDVPLDGDAMLSQIETAVRTLLEHPVLARLTEVPERVVEVEQLSRIRLWGIDIWLSPDVIVSDGQGGFVVVDWKTGRVHKSDAVTGQLALYALYVIDRYLRVRADGTSALPLDRVKGLVAHTSKGAFHNQGVDTALVSMVRGAITQSVPKMRGDAVSALGETPPKSAFPMVEEGASACAWCGFRRTCERE